MMVTLLRVVGLLGGLVGLYARALRVHTSARIRVRVGLRATALITAAVVAVTALATGFNLANPAKVQAASQSTLNFQARLQTNPGGAIVADGDYNVEFKLYSAASGGTALWTGTFKDTNGVTAGNDYRIRVSHGYLSVALGDPSVNSGNAAFPSTINWDQSLWITMNIGGTTQTATPTWNGEMNPRLALTAVPYAFRAGQLAKFNAGTGFTSTLSLTSPTGGDQNFVLPDMQAAGTYTLLTGSNGIQNTTVSSLQSNASIAIQSASDSNITGYFQGRTNQTADLIQLKLGSSQSGNALNIVDSSNNPLFKIASTGVLTQTQDANFSARLGIGGAVASAVQLQVTAAASNVGLRVDGNGSQGIADFRNGSTSVATIGNTGQTTLQNSADSTSALNVKKSAGAGGVSVFNVDTQNGRVGIGNATPGYALDVAGSVNLTTGNSFKINGTDICTSSGCTTSSASAIQNSTSTQGNASFAIQSAADANVTGYFEGRASQSADLVRLKLGSSQSGNAINVIDGSNNPLFKIASTGVLTQTQDANLTARLSVGTSVVSGVQLKVLAATSNVGLQVDGNGTQGILDLRNGSTSVATVGNTGQTTFKNSSDSTSGFQVQKSNSATPILNVDTQNSRVGVNNATPGYALDVTGSVNVTTGNTYKINGADICTSSGCTIAAASGIQNSTSVQNNASLAISSAADTNITALLQGRTSQSVDLMQLKLGTSQTGNALNIVDGSNNPLFKIASTGVLTQTQDANFSARLGLGTTVASGIQLKVLAGSGNVGLQIDGNGTQGIADFRNGSTSVATIGSAGATTFKNSSDSTSGFQVQKSNVATPIFNVDTQNSRVGINNATPGHALDVTGSVNVSSGNTYKIAGTDICTASGCIASAASGIQNTTSTQTNASLAISSAADANITAFLQGRASQSADLMQLKLGATQSGNAINIVDSTNAPLFKIASTGVLTQTQDANFSARLAIGTTVASGIQLKVLAAASNVGLQVDGNGTQGIADFRNGSASVATIGNTGQTTFQNSTDSATAFSVKKAAPSGASVFSVDTQNSRVGVNNASPQHAVDVAGNVNVGSSNSYKIGGADVCTSVGCTISATSGIQNTTTVQTNASLAISSAADANITANLQGRTNQSAAVLLLKAGSAQTGDLLQIQNSGGGVLANFTSAGVLKIGTAGTATLGGAQLFLGYGEFSGTLRIGDATNGADFNSSTGLSLRGTARTNRRVTLPPEFPGATMTAPSSGVTAGSMTSDFCNNSLDNVDCPQASDVHNYYSWSATGATASYDIYVRYQVPSDYSRNADNSATFAVNLFGYRKTASDSVTLEMYNAAGAQCGSTTTVSTSTAQWSEVALSGTGTAACNAIVANDMVYFKIRLTSSGSANPANVGELRFDYKAGF